MGDIIDFKKISQSEIGDFVLSPEDAIRNACINYLGFDIIQLSPSERIALIEMIYKSCVAKYLKSIE